MSFRVFHVILSAAKNRKSVRNKFILCRAGACPRRGFLLTLRANAGAGVRWTPHGEAVKHRPSRQARIAPTGCESNTICKNFASGARIQLCSMGIFGCFSFLIGDKFRQITDSAMQDSAKAGEHVNIQPGNVVSAIVVELRSLHFCTPAQFVFTDSSFFY